MLLEKFGDDFVFLLKLRLQIVDFFFLAGFTLASPSSLLEGRFGVVEEDFLPVVDVVGLDPLFIAKVRNRHFIDEILLQNGRLAVAFKSSALLLHHFLLVWGLV